MEHYTKIRRSFFENINKINKPLAKLTNGNSDRIQMNKIRNEKGNITAKTEEFQKIIRSYYKSLYSKKKKILENLNAMDNF